MRFSFRLSSYVSPLGGGNMRELRVDDPGTKSLQEEAVRLIGELFDGAKRSHVDLSRSTEVFETLVRVLTYKYLECEGEPLEKLISVMDGIIEILSGVHPILADYFFYDLRLLIFQSFPDYVREETLHEEPELEKILRKRKDAAERWLREGGTLCVVRASALTL